LELFVQYSGGHVHAYGQTGDRQMTARRRNSAAGLAQQSVVGFVGGLLAGAVMNIFSRAVTSATHGREGSGAAPGSNRVGRGAQPPQAQGAADDDAAVRVGTAAYRAVTGSAPNRAARRRLGTMAHYVFSGALGACYALVARRLPIVRAGHGIAYGTAVWILADEMVIPLLDLSRGPRQLPPGVHAYALAGHWVYGFALESSVRSASRERRQSAHSSNP
jgi:Protein of unknown function (DUF1440)